MSRFTQWVEAVADEPLEAVVIRSLDSRFKPLLHYATLAARHPGRDCEYVHQMRVWTRRVAVALWLYGPLLPKRRRKRLAAQVKSLRRASNDARDTDVFAQRLAADRGQSAAARLLKRVRSHRRDAQRPIVEVYHELFERERLMRQAAKLLRKIRLRKVRRRNVPTAAVPVCFGPWAEQRIQPLLDEFFAAAAADLTDLAILHRFRIVGKKLRYAIELLAAGFSERVRAEAYPAIRDLQDRLGEINDLDAAQARLGRWLEVAAVGEQTAYIRALMSQTRHLLEQRHPAFLIWWNAYGQAELRRSLTDLRPAPAPEPS